jgi:hypothetical protein
MRDGSRDLEILWLRDNFFWLRDLEKDFGEDEKDL